MYISILLIAVNYTFFPQYFLVLPGSLTFGTVVFYVYMASIPTGIIYIIMDIVEIFIS